MFQPVKPAVPLPFTSRLADKTFGAQSSVTTGALNCTNVPQIPEAEFTVTLFGHVITGGTKSCTVIST